MHTTLIPNRTARREARNIYFHHKNLILSGKYPIPVGASAITFRPGDQTSNFYGKRFRPIGTAVMVRLLSEESHNLRMPSLSLTGYRRVELRAGHTEYLENDPIFHFAGERPPKKWSTGRQLDAYRNPSLSILLVRMYGAIHTAVQKRRCVKSLQLPRIVLGFAETNRPRFEITDALYNLAALKLGKEVNKLGSLGEVILNRYLENLWNELWISPDHLDNRTGLWLIDEKYCSSTIRVISRFEDFGDLIGRVYRNPVDDHEFVKCANPAKLVIASRSDADPPASTEECGEQLRVMRVQIGPLEKEFSDKDLLWGLENPEQQLVACESTLPYLRSLLPTYWSECTTDEDLLLAARFPKEMLWASGACRIQVVNTPN